MIGRKIRELRLHLGLSQQQLGGAELSRSMICLLEKGRSNPSCATLQILAQRLGKPVEYFLEDTPDPGDVQVVETLLKYLERNGPKNLPDAIRQVISTVKLSQRLDRPDLEGQARLMLGRLHMEAGQWEQAIEVLDECADMYRMAHMNNGVAMALFQAGKAAFLAEDLAAARRYYNRALRVMEQRKDLLELRCRCLINLATCCLRLSVEDFGQRYYQEALEAANLGGLGAALQGQAAMGLGLVYRQQKDLPRARQVMLTAMDFLASQNHPSLPMARHNLGVILAGSGDLAGAIAIFQDCFALFRESGDTVRQASVQEELAGCHLRCGELAAAEHACREALSLLDVKDEGIIRGRVYRLLGQIHEQRGNQQRSTELYWTSREILRRVRANQELATTNQYLEALLPVGETP